MMQALEQFLMHETVVEIVIRTLCVLGVSEGCRIAIRTSLYQAGIAKRKVMGLSEFIGLFTTMGVGVWMSFVYAGNKPDIFYTVSEGLFYGIGTLFVHWGWIKYMDYRTKKKEG